MALQIVKAQTVEEAAELAEWDMLGEAIDAAYPDFLERVKKDAITPVVLAYESRLRAVELTLERLALLPVVQGQQVIIDLLGTLLKEKQA